jgi:hypothetical protein
MGLIDKLKQVERKELVLPFAGIVNAVVLTYCGAEASDYLSDFIKNNLAVGAIVDAAEFAVGWGIMHYPVHYTLRNVYGISDEFSFRHPIESVKSIFLSAKSHNRLKKDVAVFGLVTSILSTSLVVARPFVYADQMKKVYDEKKASLRVDIPMNGFKCLVYNALGLYLLHESRKVKDSKGNKRQD